LLLLFLFQEDRPAAQLPPVPAEGDRSARIGLAYSASTATVVVGFRRNDDDEEEEEEEAVGS
jgi:hypothetical protein